MTATSDALATLPPLQRRMAEAWLTRFEDGWNSHKLHECMRALPNRSILRRPLLLAMIQRDLAHQWQSGLKITIEEYQRQFPELGAVDELPIELIAAEYHVRQKHGDVELADFAERFPSRVDELYLQLKPKLFDSQAAKAPSAEDLAERRRRLLMSPLTPSPEPEVANAADERLRKLLGVAPPSPAASAPPAPAPAPPAPTRTAPPTPAPVESPPESETSNGHAENTSDGSHTGTVNLFDTPGPPRVQPTGSVPVQPAERVWLDVEKLQDHKKSGKSTPRAAGAPTPPPQFGRYAIERKLVDGSQGALYDARDTQLERRVLIKIPALPPEQADTARALFHREARAAATVFHPSLCPIYDVGQIDKIDFLVMPHVEGEVLSDTLQRQPTWTTRQAAYLVARLAAALDIAHRQGVVHRDLRPSHIVLAGGSAPVIVGFGRAGHAILCDDPISAAYVAPELMAEGESGGPRSDIYSLGVVLHQIVHGHVPGQTPPDTSGRPVSEPDSALRSIIRRAIAPSPDDRYASMRELAADLESYLKATPSIEDLELPPVSLQRLSPSTLHGVQPLSGSGSSTGVLSHVQELRAMSSQGMTSPKPVAASSYRRRTPWPWYVASAVAGAAIMLTILSIVNRTPPAANPSGPVEPDTKQANPPKKNEPTLDELLAGVMQMPPGSEREEKARVFEGRRSDAPAIRKRIVDDPWPQDSDGESNGRNSLLRALRYADPTELLPTLEQAASPKVSANPELRLWACDRAYDIAKSDPTGDWKRILRFALLYDPASNIRTYAAHQLRKLPEDEETVATLVARITDETWLVEDAANQRVDPSRAAALASLAHLAPDRIKDALNMAKRSRNPKVRGWAFEAYRERFPLESMP